MESQPQRGVSTRPLAAYIGGKRNLAARIIELIEATPHELYGEAFLGMGGVFLRRRQAAKVEVVNDISGDVTTFFRILQRHYVPFLDMLKWQLTSRADFDRLMEVKPETLTDLERAARFLYLQRTAYGGKVGARNFGTTRTTPARFDLTKLVPMLEEVHERLTRVTIERLHFEAFIKQYDRAGALFYLDPPYYGCELDYGADLFGRMDFDRLAIILSGLKGRFILSLNDVIEVRRTFSRFKMDSVDVTYSVGGGDAAKKVSEVIITGP